MSALNHDWETCELAAWRGDEARCRWCDSWLRKSPNRLFCSLDCKYQAIENHAWNTAKVRVRARDKRCVGCGARKRLGVHHREPCNGIRTFSCAHHLTNLELLCDLCHEEAHVLLERKQVRA